MGKSPKVKVAVVGFGHLGKWHCQKAAACDNAELVAIVEKMEAGQKAAREAFPKVPVLSDLKDALDKADAFVVVTPTSPHFSLVSLLREKKKQVFFE